MTDIYCGANKLPKGKRLGTMKECAEKKKISLYGLYKIDPKLIEAVKNNKVKPVTREKLMLKVVSLKLKIKKARTNLKELEQTKKGSKKGSKKGKDKLEKDIKKMVEQLNDINKEIDDIESHNKNNNNKQGGGSKKAHISESSDDQYNDDLSICE